MQPPFRKLHFGSSLRFDLCRCIAVRHPCFDFATEEENALSRPMKANTHTTRDTVHVAYFGNRKQPRFIEPQRCELPITFGHPLVAQSLYGETLF